MAKRNPKKASVKLLNKELLEGKIGDFEVVGGELGEIFMVEITDPGSEHNRWSWKQKEGKFQWPILAKSEAPDSLSDVEVSEDAPSGKYNVRLLSQDGSQEISRIKIKVQTVTSQETVETNFSVPLAKIAEALDSPAQNELLPPGATPECDLVLWAIIRHSTIDFNKLNETLSNALCQNNTDTQNSESQGSENIFWDADSYGKLKDLVDKYMLENICSFGETDAILEDLTGRHKMLGFTDPIAEEKIKECVETYYDDNLEGHVFPYLSSVKDVKGMPDPDDSDCRGILKARMTQPLMAELIWCYFHEESMLSQTLKAISLRFQNKKWKHGTDPLVSLNTNPLRRLSNLIWGFIQEEQHRLSVKRRAYGYDNMYGITLHGAAVGQLQPADSRTSFLSAFHRLLYLCTVFYKEVDDMTIRADAFLVKSALREVHLVLSEGAHNQYGDMPWVAKREMLIEQFILARPEMREYLGGRVMVPYKEGWMEPVDTMKRLQNWTDVGVEQFAALGRLGEQLLLSIRFGNWNAPAITASNAYNWAKYWRNEIQDYIHSYRAISGVDLTIQEQVDGTPPSEHLRRRLTEQKSPAAK